MAQKAEKCHHLLTMEHIHNGEGSVILYHLVRDCT